MDTSELHLVEEYFAYRLALLSGAAFSFGTKTAVWHESQIPLTAIEEGAGLQHLAFNAWIDSAPNNARMARSAESGTDAQSWIQCAVTVAFAYQLRMARQIADSRLAMKAAALAARGLLSFQTTAETTTYGEINITPVNIYIPAMDDGSEWLLVTQQYTAAFEMTLTP